MANPNQYGSRMNMWAMLKNLTDKNIGILTTTDSPPTSSTYAGFAAVGSLLIHETTGVHYINKGTKATPDWKAITSA